MRIRSLEVSNLRILENLKIEPSPGLNFIVGDNGAGKTSVLEAIYLAGRGRTFRHTDAGPMIRTGAEYVTVVLETEDIERERRSILGVRRGKKDFTCRLDGKDIQKRSELADALPVQWIGSQPQLFLALGPDVRRRFIDMGLFHVEQSFLKVLTEFQRNLRQRNAAIRLGRLDAVRIWDLPLSNAAESLNAHRLTFVRSLMTRAQEIHSAWDQDYSLSYRFKSGWQADAAFLDQLEKNVQVDMKLGYTNRGPQRAELELFADGGLAEKILSRGQQKLLVVCLNLALMDLLVSGRRTTPIFMADDLAAELDPVNRARLIDELESRAGQVFLTKIEENSLKAVRTGSQTFHVEHGTLCEP